MTTKWNTDYQSTAKGLYPGMVSEINTLKNGSSAFLNDPHPCTENSIDWR